MPLPKAPSFLQGSPRTLEKDFPEKLRTDWWLPVITTVTALLAPSGTLHHDEGKRYVVSHSPQEFWEI